MDVSGVGAKGLECAPFPKVIRFEAVVTRKVDSLECAPFPKVIRSSRRSLAVMFRLECAPFPKVIRYVPKKKPL